MLQKVARKGKKEKKETKKKSKKKKKKKKKKTKNEGRNNLSPCSKNLTESFSLCSVLCSIQWSIDVPFSWKGAYLK
jgi:hypothetical protein